jgi:ferredoxin
MGHIVNVDREYRLLQQRLDRHLTGAPDSPAFMKILRFLFAPEEAAFARRIPSQPTTLEDLSRRLDMPEDELSDKMIDMARRGLVIDVQRNGRLYFSLAPVVIGFFEFTFMRTRDDLPMAELARLFDLYMKEDDRFVRSVFQGETQIGRSLVHEEALPETDHTEILDWERSSQIIRSASTVGVSLCACWHKASHLGRACDRPQEICLTFNYGADAVIRSGLARPITTDEAMRLLETAKEAGLAQTGDNVQRKVTYICNCCGCCCGMVQAIKDYDVRNAIVTSNWIMEVDLDNCKGCGKCVKACPVDAIDLAVEGENKKKRRWAVRDERVCLGCGVCYTACKSGAITMKSRAQRVFTPETIFDRMVAMAIERGKLAELLFDEPERLSHRALGRIVGILQKSPPFKVAMAVKPLRSAFMNTIIKGAKRSSGEIGDVVG